jgi:hypothetical protein
MGLIDTGVGNASAVHIALSDAIALDLTTLIETRLIV